VRLLFLTEDKRPGCKIAAPRLQELHEGPWSQRDLDGGANIIIPIPAPLGGAVVVGENVVAYFNEGGPPKVTPIQPTIVQVGQVTSKGPPHEACRCARV
jgi:hypothetical protein